jgi:hypothetical protein
MIVFGGILKTSFDDSFSVFSAATPKFRCRIPECESSNGSFENAFAKHFDIFTFPQDQLGSAQCFRLRYSGNTSSEGVDQCVASNFASTAT